LGCGFAIKEKGEDVRTVVVAIYEPAGIRVTVDDYIDNIMPPKQQGNPQFSLVAVDYFFKYKNHRNTLINTQFRASVFY